MDASDPLDFLETGKMKLQIDNFDGTGARDYSSAIDSTKLPRVVRKLNQSSQLRASLVADLPSFVVPSNGGRLTLAKINGKIVFTGFLTGAPSFEYLGWGQSGPVYRYNLIAVSDEMTLDRKRLPYRAPFVARSAGSALARLTNDVQPEAFDTRGVQGVDVLASYAPDPQKSWSQHAGEIALRARASYRTQNGALVMAPVGALTYALNESDPGFYPEGLKLQPRDGLINDVTVMGEIEPQAYVKDYFVGDGLTLKFYLSQTPFTKSSRVLFDEEYSGTGLNPTRWVKTDPEAAVSLSSGNLQIAGGNGTDAGTTVQFVELVELGGATVLQHGDVIFTAPSQGVLGGLYAGSITKSGCLAGFQITPTGTESTIQALVNGAATGPEIATAGGHHYVLTTRLYSLVIFREQQTFHSVAHPAGSGIGGTPVPAEVRVVLEVHEIDPANPATQVTASTLLYDGVIPNAPQYCTYVLVNAQNMQCSIAFTRMSQAIDAEVRSALPGGSYATLLVGSLSGGAACNIVSGPSLSFFTSYVPAPNQLIEVHYRGSGRSATRVSNPLSIAAQTHGNDDGIRSVLRHVKAPEARTASDCENAALAILEGSTGTAWEGEYDVWSDFLPGGAADIFPGDALEVNARSRAASFQTIVREVEIDFWDLEGERSRYKIKFADDCAAPLGFQFEKTNISTAANPALDLTAIANTQVGGVFLSDLTAAELTSVSSTTISVDAGSAPTSNGGIEVRWSDTGWGPGDSRNLVGRFGSQTFTLPRLSRVQTVFLRQYDASMPPRYSRYSTALHVDYPL